MSCGDVSVMRRRSYSTSTARIHWKGKSGTGHGDGDNGASTVMVLGNWQGKFGNRESIYHCLPTSTIQAGSYHHRIANVHLHRYVTLIPAITSSTFTTRQPYSRWTNSTLHPHPMPTDVGDQSCRDTRTASTIGFHGAKPESACFEVGAESCKWSRILVAREFT